MYSGYNCEIANNCTRIFTVIYTELLSVWKSRRLEKNSSDVLSEPTLTVPYRTVSLILLVFSIQSCGENAYYSAFPDASQTAAPVHTLQIKFHNNVL